MDHFIHLYAKIAQAALKKFGLEPDLHCEHVSALGNNKLVLGIPHVHADTIAQAIGAAEQSEILAGIIPVRPEGGLFSDGRNLAADLFFVYDGRLTLLRTDKPVRLDGVNCSFMGSSDHLLGHNCAFINTTDIFNVTDDKIVCADYLSRGGLHVPDSEVLHEDNLEQALGAFFARPYDGFVIKASRGSGGQNVRLYKEDGFDKALQFARLLMESEEVLAQRRIIPLEWKGESGMAMTLSYESLHAMDDGFDVEIAPQNNDWNVRVLTIAHKGDAKVICANVRYKSFGNSPVNIHNGASASTLECVCNETGADMDAILDTAVSASRLLAEHSPNLCIF
ncbi:hypothetical protein KY329_01870, partial [Candidatus Woesearchaeota archaeon]|nr:hypothetical protein [Candidatus Woesearchaeota archaeon]